MAEALNGNRRILVVGGGIAGLSAALEAAEAGFPVSLVEKEAYLGGRVARMNKYFPKLCPPNCGLEINFRRLKNNPLIQIVTLAEVEKVEGEAGNFEVSLRINPRYVNEKCTACGLCEAAAITEVPDPFNYGLKQVKAAHLPHEFAFPLRYVLAPEVIGTNEAEQIKARLAQFLRDDLKLELSEEKTLITHARTGAARFLGYEITVQHGSRKIVRGRRAVNGSIGLRVPRSVIKAKSARYMQRGKPARRTQLMNIDDHDIMASTGPSTGASSSTTCWPATSRD